MNYFVADTRRIYEEIAGRFAPPAEDEELYRLRASLDNLEVLLGDIADNSYIPDITEMSDAFLYWEKICKLRRTVATRAYDVKTWLYNKDSLKEDADHRIRSAYAFLIMLQEHDVYEQIDLDHIDNTISVLNSYDQLFMRKLITSGRAQSALLQIVGSQKLTRIRWHEDEPRQVLICRIREACWTNLNTFNEEQEYGNF
ncbi:protein of unknown function [Taphrina deformans PYCC 5710]|uniref:Uncharacterized protein n=1 Tax=Taphrina deformans (strain PYCC 5710 / ATCC 11124 / CBS 356.35 / IMI 108563 / JCM 9778 / NBRC 8474) TaxID=1097556 RepID=R4XFV3_TAPDE|nr:protein of unknown function [Taphrina deformans PYCC 5710]|eukprot:CCG84620.1 protein of unknown function [Taphrina deformans PYCC 5710]